MKLGSNKKLYFYVMEVEGEEAQILQLHKIRIGEAEGYLMI